MSDLSQLRLGTAPDSWGVWFPSDPHQVTWDVYLDEIAAVGYVYTELGPQGFMPQDPAQLKEELARRNLTVCGGTVFAGLHKGKDALDKAIAEFSQEARLLAAVGAEYLVHLPEQYTDQHTGCGHRSRATSTPSSGRTSSPAPTSWPRSSSSEYGVKLVFHPHADTHVDTQDRIERFLSDTDPELVNLCLDTGHVSYCEGDNIEIIKALPRADHLRAPQVGRPRRPRPRPRGEDAALGVGQARHHVRAAVRRAGHAAAPRRARQASTARSTP